LLLAVFGTALAVINTSYKHRMAFYELQQSRGQTNNLDVQWGQLLIEQSTFGLEGRIERRAIDELGMKLPDWSTIKMVRHE
jgi:cell division protein FtsL